MLIEAPAPLRRQRESGGEGTGWRLSAVPACRSAIRASTLQSAPERRASVAASVVGFSPLVPRDSGGACSGPASAAWAVLVPGPVVTALVPGPDDPQLTSPGA